MAEITKEITYVLQNDYTGNWQDFMPANKPDDLVVYAEKRKKAVKTLKQRVIERTVWRCRLAAFFLVFV